MKRLLAWVLPILSLVVIGPLAASPVGGLRGPMGSGETTLLIGQPFSGLVAFGLVAALAALMAGASGKLLGPSGRSMALIATGLVVAWAALRTGNMERVYIESLGLGASAGMLVALLLVEGTLVLGAGLVLATIVRLASGSGRGEGPGPTHGAAEPAVGAWLAAIGSRAGVLTLGGALVGSIAGAWLVAQTGLRGQGLMAGVLGGVAGAVAGVFAGQSNTARAPELASFAGVLLAAAVSPLILLVMPGLSDLGVVVRAGDAPGPALVQPLDWLAGALLGWPVGVGWGESLFSSERTHAAARPKVRRASA